MQTSKHGNGNGLGDLYILPETYDEYRQIADWMNARGERWTLDVSDVPGQEWHGKSFFTIHFGESLLPALEDHLKRLQSIA